jgi:hypothetical protein
MSASSPDVNLLWTGGWDSTFRLLDLVLVQERSVQPYYLVDPGRASAAMELKTKGNLREKLPADLVAPTICRDVTDVAENPAITERFERIRAWSALWPQYDWLTRFVAQEEVEGLELTIHRDDRLHAVLEGHVEPAGDNFVLRSGVADPDLGIFRPFRFPLFEMTKLEMQTEAERHGFAELLEQTWFCHEPTARGEPCGDCMPCRFTRREGLGRRIPVSGHVRYYRRRVPRRIKQAPRKLLRKTPLRRPVRALLRRRRAAAQRAAERS